MTNDTYMQKDKKNKAKHGLYKQTSKTSKVEEPLMFYPGGKVV